MNWPTAVNQRTILCQSSQSRLIARRENEGRIRLTLEHFNRDEMGEASWRHEQVFFVKEHRLIHVPPKPAEVWYSLEGTGSRTMDLVLGLLMKTLGLPEQLGQ